MSDFSLLSRAIISGGKMAAEKVTQNLPWVEKYRPKHLDDLISHKEIISTSKLPVPAHR